MTQQQRANNERLMTLIGCRVDQNSLGWRILRPDELQWASGCETREQALDTMDFYSVNNWGAWLREEAEAAIFRLIFKETGNGVTFSMMQFGKEGTKFSSSFNSGGELFMVQVLPIASLIEAKVGVFLLVLDELEEAKKQDRPVAFPYESSWLEGKKFLDDYEAKFGKYRGRVSKG